MSDTPSWNDPAGAAGPDGTVDPASTAGPDGTVQTRPSPRPRRGLRIAIISMASFVVFVGAIAAGGYFYVNHLASSIPRIPVQFARLSSTDLPAGGSRGGMNVLITGDGGTTVGDQVPPPNDLSGLIMILHINANQKAGGVVSIPPATIVEVPGHGRTKIWNALTYGGPTLLVRTVENLTHVQLEHYARIDFPNIENVINVIGGVNVILPETTTSYGHTFHVGVNHLNGLNGLRYARQPSLTQEGRVLRQQSLIRAVLHKLANRHLLTNPVTMYRVLHAIIGMLTVDSNFTNAELMQLATELGALNSSAGTFVTAPVHYRGTSSYLIRPVSDQLWAAIRQDAIAAFARKYPSTVTPVAPR